MAKTFVLHDESLNEHGFWIKTSGIDLTQFRKNPIMLWMHNRAWRGTKDEILPIGHWDNIRIEEDKILADAIFDSDDFSKSIEAKVESNTIRMASPGFRILIMSEDIADLKPGQFRATVLKSVMREASICDSGANDNALALYDESDQLIKLSGDMKDKRFPSILNSKSSTTMKKVIKLFSDLQDDAGEDQIATKVIELQGKVQTMQAEIDKFMQQKQAALKSEADSLTEAAVKDGRIEAAAKPHFLKMFESDHESAKAALAAIKPHQSVAGKIGEETTKENPLTKLSWDEIDKKGDLENLKSKDPDLYKEKFKEKFGREPKNV
jgi:outer membrane murein-binding lipoprotein Lpp